MIKLITVALMYLTAFVSLAGSEKECLISDPIECYECDSDFDKRCHDPFNYTSRDLNKIKVCKGCCVKIVENYNTPQERIRRVCTRQLDINLFMIDHVCMKEHDKTGHMCFCENSLCNGVQRIKISSLFATLLLISHIFLM